MHHPIVERLLRIMDRKDHWAWPAFTRAGLTRAQLLVHFRHEYHTYVRDFPVLLARVLGQGPPASVRNALSENIYEEQTGRLSLGVAHPELFLEMMEGLSFAREDIERADPPLEPEAIEYRRFLERAGAVVPWQAGAAVLTIFVEGSKYERADLEETRTPAPIDEAIAEHTLVVHYGCPPEKMRLVRAHRMVEGGHRKDAWNMVVENVPPGGKLEDDVLSAVERAHDAWSSYRDGVARAMGMRSSTASGGRGPDPIR
jgi:pyrroloquinoline-quinone synthase